MSEAIASRREAVFTGCPEGGDGVCDIACFCHKLGTEHGYAVEPRRVAKVGNEEVAGPLLLVWQVEVPQRRLA